MVVPPLYFDHDVSGYTERLLRHSGYDVVTASEAGLANAGDGLQLATAANAHRVLVSHNAKEYRLLHDAWLLWTDLWGIVTSHAGILIIPQPPKWPHARAAAEITAFFDSSPAIENELYEWRSEDRQWERRIRRLSAPKQNL